MIEKLRALLHSMSEIRAFSYFKTIFETLDGILFGVRDRVPMAPHLRDNIEIKRFMSAAIIALLPATAAAVVFYGWYALAIILVSYVAGGVTEVAFALIRRRHIEEGFLVTGLIFPLVLPPTSPLWIVAVGSVFGVFFGKEVFGGTGRNIFNPALVGRLFITIAFPMEMSASWKVPFADAVTTATPLASFKSAGELTSYSDLLFGGAAGSMGEIVRIGIILGGIVLMATKVANWRIPVFYLASVALFSFIGNLLLPETIAPPLFQLLSGGLLFGAMFMVTDPVTSPYNGEAKVVFGILVGLLTVLIRGFSGYTEGVMFSIIFMNALTPLIDHFTVKAKYKAVVR